VFDNLMTNALRHTDRGGTIILRAAAAEGTVQFSVEDTGEGIPAQFVPRVFDKFFRIPGTKHHGGAGLGLAIVHEIIVSHGGQIGVQSTTDKGTTFTFSLPAAAVSQDEAGTGRLDLVSSSSTS
ncbi:MAG: sensor histidine kinase, partial [Isosphaeraceae bacterium]